jgi:hypothetical protein
LVRFICKASNVFVRQLQKKNAHERIGGQQGVVSVVCVHNMRGCLLAP